MNFERFGVMAGLVPAIHVLHEGLMNSWMPGIDPGMTRQTRDAP